MVQPNSMQSSVGQRREAGVMISGQTKHHGGATGKALTAANRVFLRLMTSFFWALPRPSPSTPRSKRSVPSCSRSSSRASVLPRRKCRLSSANQLHTRLHCPAQLSSRTKMQLHTGAAEVHTPSHTGFGRRLTCTEGQDASPGQSCTPRYPD